MVLVGEHLERPTYRILNTIGEGAQGVCVLAEHDVFGGLVVQKTVGTIGQSDSAIRTTCEPAILHRILHDRIVRVTEAQWDPDPQLTGLNAVTFIMPYYEEGSVHGALTGGHRFRVSDAVRVACDVLSALACMHDEHQLVHRDVKPANVLLEPGRARAVLSDLGSAGYVDPATGGLSSTGMTPLYQSPESGISGVATASCDVYAVGMLMVEMLNGRLPYEDIDWDDVDARLHAGKRAVSDALLDPAPWVPQRLATVIRSLCHRDPCKRPSSAAEALRQLQNLRIVDWRHDTGDGPEGVWTGYWPPEVRRKDQRVTRVAIVTVDRGRQKGQRRAESEWSRGNGKWRRYRDLTRTIDRDDAALRRYFRDVDARAQSAPTS